MTDHVEVRPQHDDGRREHAKRRFDQIVQGVNDQADLIALAIEERDWETLGYDSLRDWYTNVASYNRVKPEIQRRLVEALKAQGYSFRAIGEHLNISKDTAQRALTGKSGHEGQSASRGETPGSAKIRGIRDWYEAGTAEQHHGQAVSPRDNPAAGPDHGAGPALGTAQLTSPDGETRNLAVVVTKPQPLGDPPAKPPQPAMPVLRRLAGCLDEAHAIRTEITPEMMAAVRGTQDAASMADVIRNHARWLLGLADDIGAQP